VVVVAACLVGAFGCLADCICLPLIWDIAHIASVIVMI